MRLGKEPSEEEREHYRAIPPCSEIVVEHVQRQRLCFCGLSTELFRNVQRFVVYRMLLSF